MSRPFKYFPSHAFRYGGHHDSFQELLEKGSPRGVSCHSFAPTTEHPIHAQGDNIHLANALLARIQRSDIFFSLAGVYASHSKWMNFEISAAAVLGIPIIAIAPNGQERLSTASTRPADDVVRWRSDSVWRAVQEALPSERWCELTGPLFIRI